MPMQRVFRQAALATLVSLAALGVAAAPSPAAPAPGASAALADTLDRHPLETRALVEPEAVLAELVPALRDARIADDQRLVAQLELARANACRVVANWDCQREAGIAARTAALAAGAPNLEVRGLIAESRARIAVGDYTRGERLLGEAELVLRANPKPELLADVYLAYSSMSYSLGKHALAAEYADRGLATLAPGEGLAMQSRLLRNRARAEAQLGNLDAARATLDRATGQAGQLDDPKLVAELQIERARIARLTGDLRTQREAGFEVLTLAGELKNSQLSGLGHEVLGLAEIAAGNRTQAVRAMEASLAAFRGLDLPKDERRVLNELIAFLLAKDPTNPKLGPMFERFLVLDGAITQSERSLAADDFDARLKYAEREAEVARLQAESLLAQEREQALAESNRRGLWLMALGLVTVLVLAAFFVAQRRNSTRLAGLLETLRERESQYRTLADNSSDLVVRMTAEGKRRYVSPSSWELLGYRPEELAEPRWDLVHPDDRAHVAEALQSLATDGGARTVAYRIRHRHGHYVWFEALARRVDGEAGPEILYTGRDITQRMRAEQALAASQARLQAVADNIPAMIAHVDTQERYTFANEASRRILSLGGSDLVGRTVREVRGEAVYSEIQGHVARALRGERVDFEGEAEVAGRHYHYQSSYVPDVDASGEVQGFYSFVFDITQLKLAEQGLARMAREDALTGLANRRQFDERLAQTLARAARSGSPVAVLYLDLDRFKQVNDRHGHAAGDAVLVEVGKRLREITREGDLAARLGGDEFTVLLEGLATSQDAVAAADKVLRALTETLEGGAIGGTVGVSIGIGLASGAVTADALMAAADRALYEAKAAGRGCWRLASAP